MTNSFYIHIPFCTQKCPYCKFALTPIFDEFKKKRYLEYLKKEISEYFESGIIVYSGGLGEETVGASGKEKKGGAKLPYPKGISIASQRGSFSSHNAFDTFGNKSMENSIGKVKTEYTVYFGGGTPSILSHDEIREILECFPFYRKISTEITLESNPEDITQAYVEGLIELGINRLSMGVQTLNDKSLKEIHRSDKNNIIHALESIKQATHNKNISVNVDFILGLPYTQKGETLDAIKFIHASYPNITHTSVYMLEDEDYPKHWKAASISENELQDEFLSIIDYFESRGWNHYELSNFSKYGFESQHNQAYWNHSHSRGFGLSSSSYENQKRWNNASSFQGYYNCKIENEELLDSTALEIEDMMFGLRTHGWTLDENQLLKHRVTLEKLESKNYITIEKNTIKMTKTGIFLIDYAISELL